MELTPVLLLLSFLLLLVLVMKRDYKPSVNLPPGPWRLPLIGSLHHILTALPHQALHQLAQQHGPFMLLRLGQTDMLVVSTPAAASVILKSQDLNFCTRPEFYVAKVLTYGFTNIVSAPYGDYWRQLRKICTVELLSSKRVRSFHSIFEQEISKLITDIRYTSSERKPVNLSDKLVGLTNTIIARCAFGSNSKHQQRFIPAMKEALELASGFSAVDLFPSLKFIDLLSGTRSNLNRIHRLIDEIMGGIIEEHEVKLPAKRDDDVEDLVDVLLRVKNHGELEFPLTNDNIKAVIMDMFIAGSETTASVLAWAMSELVKNSQKMDKAQEEVRRVLRGKTKITESDLGELHYLKLVIKETLRLHPPAPLLAPREAIHTCQVDKYTIPAGTRVVVNAWALGRDPRYWDDAGRFKPERFSGNPVDFKGANFEYVPFGAGRRICPAMTFGSNTMGFILSRLLYNFNWELTEGMRAQELDMTESFGAAATRKNDLCLVAIPYCATTL